ncbi:hypothetical protein [Paraburkholderia caledonica]|uniref:hypothetical protein n=1 Tax=Paraburkholderia caledonica TaxID=134536 RepID=UPI000B4064B9|nr:hypothetical protein [Paraburkholderia caledonica]
MRITERLVRYANGEKDQVDEVDVLFQFLPPCIPSVLPRYMAGPVEERLLLSVQLCPVEQSDERYLTINMPPLEALEFAASLVSEAQRLLHCQAEARRLKG